MSKLIKVKDFNDFELSHMLSGKLLELLIDTKEKEVYHVDPSIGHSRSVSIYLDIPEDEINSFNSGHLVSAIVKIEDKLVEEVLIGRSSLETGHNIKHDKKQLALAKVIIERLMKLSEQLGEVKIAEDIDKHEFVCG